MTPGKKMTPAAWAKLWRVTRANGWSSVALTSSGLLYNPNLTTPERAEALARRTRLRRTPNRGRQR